MDETWTIRDIAREYGVDPKTAHYWTTQPWFPPSIAPARKRGIPIHYDPAKVRAAVLRRRRQRSSRNARMVRAYRAHKSVKAAAHAGGVHRNTARSILRKIGEIE